MFVERWAMLVFALFCSFRVRVINAIGAFAAENDLLCDKASVVTCHHMPLLSMKQRQLVMLGSSSSTKGASTAATAATAGLGI